MTRKFINELKKCTLGKKNAEKVEISVLRLNQVIKALEQEPQTSHWICTPVQILVDESYDEAIYDTEYKCTCERCGGDFGTMLNEWHPDDNYCKYCGAKMLEKLCEDK